MSSWRLEHIADCLGSPAVLGESSGELSGISTDSRTLQAGSLFVPLVGENFDGHDYAEGAVRERGAGAVLWSRAELADWMKECPQLSVFRVDDTLQAYQNLGLFWKKLCEVQCIGITGSVGKTTTKEILAHLLEERFRVHKSRANFNNDIGVPKTLLELTPEHEVVIVEMGMRGRGQIARLVRASEPDIGIITAIGTSHLELLGSREEIARAKGELVEKLPPTASAILPRSDDFYELLESLASCPVTSYSTQADCGAKVKPDSVLAADAEGTRVLLEGVECYLPLPGEHHLHDALAAVTVARSLGMGMESIKARLESLSNPEGRAEWLDIAGTRVFLDAYNSAPESLRASLRVLQACAGRKIAVLGDILELGPDGAKVHRELGAGLKDFEVDLALCYGPLSECLAEAAQEAGVRSHWFSDKQDLARVLRGEMKPGDAVLVKASRGMALETVVDALKEKVG